METSTLNKSPSKMRQFLWPIYGREHREFLPMAVMIGLILFNYTLVRNIKDTMVVANMGAEAIVFLKFWVVLPSAIVFFLIYSKLANLMHKRTLFYSIIGFFLVFFALFAFVLYPLRDSIHPTTSADWLQSVMPQGLFGLVGVYRHWIYSVFYMMAELWGSVASAFLFFQFANDVVKVSEAKRFYAHFYLVANVLVGFSGFVNRFFSKLGQQAADGADAWGVSLNYLMSTFVFSGLIVLGLYYYLNTYVVDLDKGSDEAAAKGSGKPKKPKLSMGESLKFLFSSPYLGLIALMIICYGMSINFVEVAWKKQVGLQYTTPNDYNSFMGLLSIITGPATIIAILIGSTVVRSLGWRIAALATPIMLGGTGLLFFAAVLLPEVFAPFATILGVTPLMFAVIFGFAQNVLSKSTKYAFFDPTKEMAYIPLDSESKQKGKAAVDVVAGRFGKSGGAVVQQGLIVWLGSLAAIMPYSALIMAIIVGLWIYAVVALNKRFLKLMGEQDQAKV